jgi:hypothetical protein
MKAIIPGMLLALSCAPQTEPCGAQDLGAIVAECTAALAMACRDIDPDEWETACPGYADVTERCDALIDSRCGQ